MLMNYYRYIDRDNVQFDFAVESGENEIFDIEIDTLGGKVHRLDVESNHLKFYWKLGRVIRKGHYNIVHSHLGNRNIPVLFTALICGVRNRISHSHNTFLPRNFIFRYLKKVIMWLNVYIPTDLFACSRIAGESQFGSKQLSGGKVTVINNAIEIDNYLYNEEIRIQVRKELDLESDIVFGSVGNFTMLKNHGFMIEVFRELLKIVPDAKLVIVGFGRLMEKAKEKAIGYNIDDRVLFLGSRDDVSNLYQAFDFFILTSFNEGLSLALIEAQASGLRCIVSDNLTQESNPANLMTILKLESGAAEWANEIAQIIQLPYNRQSKKKELKAKGFDILQEAYKLEKIYLRMKG